MATPKDSLSYNGVLGELQSKLGQQVLVVIRAHGTSGDLIPVAILSGELVRGHTEDMSDFSDAFAGGESVSFLVRTAPLEDDGGTSTCFIIREDDFQGGGADAGGHLHFVVGCADFLVAAQDD